MNHQDFSSAREGDSLYSLRDGYVTVVSVNAGGIVAMDSGGFNDTWSLRGFYVQSHVTPDLYWDKPEIVAPPKPKRLVERKFECWLNVYESGIKGYTHDSEDYADKCSDADRLGPAERIIITRMVEEE